MDDFCRIDSNEVTESELKSINFIFGLFLTKPYNLLLKPMEVLLELNR
jgi:hypothetical protein